MNKDKSNHPKNIAERFVAIEATRDYHQVEGAETVSVDELPVFVRLGQTALHTLVILNQMADLPEAERSGHTHRLNPSIETYIIDPKIYDVDNMKGYKALRSGESVAFGRLHEDDLPRFNKLSDIVSRHHARIRKSSDGKSVTIEDFASTNGTYLAKSPTVRETNTDSWVPRPMDFSKKERLLLTAQGASLASERHPDTNEDTFIIDRRYNMYAVFDGVGGHDGGEVASQAAKNYISARAGDISTTEDLGAVASHLRQLLTNTNDRILKVSSEAATTAVLAKIHEIKGEIYATIAHVGDSRAYVLRYNNLLEALTTDHTPYRHNMGTGEAAHQQERFADTDTMAVLSREDIAAFKQRNIIGACLGRTNDIRADVNHFKVKPGDKIILTSDGVHDNLTTQEMQQILSNAKTSNYAELLTHAAQARSRQQHFRAKKDDMTAVVINI